MIIPYQAHVAMHRWPIANFVLIGVISLFSIAAWLEWVPQGVVEAMVLDGWSPLGMIGSLLLHGDWIHLVGNMIFLWVFGNAICAKVGNLLYVPLFCLFGLAGGVAHTLFAGGSAIGASDGINGVVAMFLVWYPINTVSCVWWIFYRTGKFDIDSRWLILLYLAFDIWGVVRGGGGVGYAAHIGGFLAGFSLAFALTYAGVIRATRHEVSLLDILGIKNAGVAPKNDDDDDDDEEEEEEEEEEESEGTRAEASRSGSDKIRFSCSGCGKSFTVNADLAGRKAKCNRCQHTLRIPPA